jgi:hypothetical protein
MRVPPSMRNDEFSYIVHTTQTDFNKLYKEMPHLAQIRDRLVKLSKSRKKKYEAIEVFWPAEEAVV